jgi:signal transduction histidine kinase
MLRVFLLVFVLLLPAAPAQMPTAPLTRVAGVRALGGASAEREAREVRLSGVVTFVNSRRSDFKIHDGSAGVGVSLPRGAECPRLGDQVEVAGVSDRLQVQAQHYPHVQGRHVRVVGRGEFPPARPVLLEDVAAFRHYDDWVAVEGVVLMWTLNGPKLSLMLAGAEAWAVVHLTGFSAGLLPEQLHGARVRVTGVNMGISHTPADTMNCPGPERLEVLQPGTADIFEAPAIRGADLLTDRASARPRVLLQGVVTAKPEGLSVYLRAEDGTALRARLMHGWLRSTTQGVVYGDNGPLPELKPGDRVELVGSALPSGGGISEAGPELHHCHARVLGGGGQPVPQTVSLAAVAGGLHDGDLVQLRGCLVHQEQVPQERGGWRLAWVVEADGVRLPVTLASRTAFDGFALQDELLLTGVVEKPAAGRQRRLLLLSQADAVSLGTSPAVVRRRLWLWGGSVAGAVGLLGLWIGTLQRGLRRQTELREKLHELNLGLEARVAERTTELERMRDDLRRALEHERELGELKSRFVTMVSHEFRTPLGIIMSAVELLRHYEGRLPAGQKEELHEDIHRSTCLMAGMMEQMLMLGRVEAGAIGCRRLPLDLDGLAVRLVTEALAASGRRCPVEWRPEPGLDGAAADEALLRHIFGNLLANAVKYSPAGAPVVFSARREGATAVFEVRDRGIGIPDQDHSRLFEAFHRCGNVGDIPGTGLGLVIVKRCVDLHGGTLEFDSAPGLGTVFTVRLPLFG